MKFGTIINCMDGRIQIPVIEYLKSHYFLDYYDVVTEAGPNGLLAHGHKPQLVQSIRDRVEISLTVHQSELIAVVGHHDCAGNPVSKELQLADIRISVQKLRSWYPTLPVVGLWVDEQWQVNKIV